MMFILFKCWLPIENPIKNTVYAEAHEKMINIVNREMTIKPAMRYHFTLVRIASIKKSTNSKC